MCQIAAKLASRNCEIKTKAEVLFNHRCRRKKLCVRMDVVLHNHRITDHSPFVWAEDHIWTRCIQEILEPGHRKWRILRFTLKACPYDLSETFCLFSHHLITEIGGCLSDNHRYLFWTSSSTHLSQTKLWRYSCVQSAVANSDWC
jgi:hypothetical protein